ncbi:unnamed protein product [Rhizophagus irregularis]|nr:unnamed protein product [Rhizophagus irregularis]
MQVKIISNETNQINLTYHYMHHRYLQSYERIYFAKQYKILQNKTNILLFLLYFGILIFRHDHMNLVTCNGTAKVWRSISNKASSRVELAVFLIYTRISIYILKFQLSVSKTKNRIISF